MNHQRMKLFQLVVNFVNGHVVPCNNFKTYVDRGDRTEMLLMPVLLPRKKKKKNYS